jgi:alpha-beta hydrolase superfamily lysophospholipase
MITRGFRKLFFGPFVRPWRWPEEVDRTDWTTVSIPRGRGALSAVFAPSERRALGSVVRRPTLGTVVFAHPMTPATKGFWLKRGHAEVFRRLGFDVVAFDFNGFGDSPAIELDFGADAVAVGRWAAARNPSLPVVGVGASFGAGHLLCALARPGQPFRAVVAEAPWLSLPSFWRAFRKQYAVLRLSQVVYPRMERLARPLDSMKRLVGSPHVLLVHGEADEVAPAEISRKLLAAAQGAGSVELWDVPHAKHNEALAADPDAYVQRVGGFLRKALRLS